MQLYPLFGRAGFCTQLQIYKLYIPELGHEALKLMRYFHLYNQQISYLLS